MFLADRAVHAHSQVVADTLGLNDSKYQYVIDALEADKYRQEREEREEAERCQASDHLLFSFLRTLRWINEHKFLPGDALFSCPPLRRLSTQVEVFVCTKFDMPVSECTEGGSSTHR